MQKRRLGNSGLMVSAVGLGMGSTTTDFGEQDDAVQIAPDDKRRKQPRFQPGNLELLKPVEAIAAKHAATTAQVALAWLFAQGDDIIPIPGTKQQKYLDENVVALDLKLAPSELALLAETFRPGARAGDRYTPGTFEMLGV